MGKYLATGHKLIQGSQEYFKHLEFSHILHMRRYGMWWKALKCRKTEKYFKQIATKVMKFYKGFTLGITWFLMNITSVRLHVKQKLRFIEISARKLHLKEKKPYQSPFFHKTIGSNNSFTLIENNFKFLR